MYAINVMNSTMAVVCNRSLSATEVKITDGLRRMESEWG